MRSNRFRKLSFLNWTKRGSAEMARREAGCPERSGGRGRRAPFGRLTNKMLSLLTIALPLSMVLGQADPSTRDRLGGEERDLTSGVLEKRALKEELRAGDTANALHRLEQWAANSPGLGSESFKLCQRFFELQSAGEWQGHREVLDQVVRTKLGQMQESLPEYLTELRLQDAPQLVLMGKLYEQYLYDGQSAEQCYTRVVRRLLRGRHIPDKVQDWRGVLDTTQFPSDLSAEEKYAIKRLKTLSDEQEIILKRIADRLDQKILAAEQELNPQQVVEPFVPNLPLDDLRRRHLEGKGTSK